ncbi:hypothetical protein A2715_04905 [Candidatus Woesebacteria bacterium RIFCSPHIGHO2_01_FULL_39_32]|uniref:NAD-dependent epimerase/dehydratase domain-containing protein n=1 Tax=Candidatus Woesebacteria bacterium RIFCSPLOWO2_01_FULL_39_25 TaxID=1802521 RepID=A0A1F8BMJ4_9BACT|nr:MAG: hypothetical protein A2124_00810 [Candidatus Woesebacteria bacterium GWB1_37_5]OGM25358.1 MAG: hypothetical protein A2715_04905 [Candidatus Woesebacteria bacterium RIFCSPHIGHO2_01_FULL_39_32]OGM37857.1 MAG: hypothetical protein A3F01_02115 [Candidatus Woesebacteria bacterium RIFCSPHIGHO2_12_FULL_38_11]OGM64889.1 MAG: hypothetical protein A2893_04515 [Candidatus Woesebacteria bacterium RIFCSPLOWO2_01_FULL_39_25]
MNKNSLILITGPTSFIGKELLKTLSKQKSKNYTYCLTWDNDSAIEKEGQRLITKLGFRLQKIDLVTKAGLKNIPSNVSTVFHLAANTNTGTKDHRVNNIGTKHLLDSLNLGPSVHIIYTSSVAFIGGRPNCRVPINERSLSYPTNEYSRTKLDAERILIKKCKKKKFRLTILRLNTVYGKNSRTNSMFAILPKLVRKNSIITRLNWPGLTSIIHVRDVIYALLYFSQHLPKPGLPSTYILYTESLTMADISKILYDSINKPYKQIQLPNFIWSLAKFGRRYIHLLEPILPASFYNIFWRTSLIVDNTVWCQTDKAYKIIKKWEPLKLKEVTRELI